MRSAMPAQRRAQGPQVRQGHQPGQRPGLGRRQVLELLGRGVSQPGAGADGRQQPRRGGLPARRGGQHVRGARPAPRTRAAASPPHTATAPGPPRPPRPLPPPGRLPPRPRQRRPRHQEEQLRQQEQEGRRGGPGDGLRTRNGTGIRGSGRSRDRLSRAARVVPGGLLHADQRLAARRLARAGSSRRGGLRAPRAQPPPGRGPGHPQPPPDLPVADPGRPPLPRPLQRLSLQRARPARRGLLHQRLRTVPQRRRVQRRHVRRRQAEHLRDPRAPEPRQPCRRDREVPHHHVGLGVLRQHRRPDHHRAPAGRSLQVQVARIRHVIQHRPCHCPHAGTILRI